MMFPFQGLEPDRGGLDTGILVIAKNCYPTTIGYSPMPSLAEHTVPALPADCKGLYTTRDGAGGVHVFSGTTTKLYKLVSSAWVDYSRTTGGNYAVADGTYWQFDTYANFVVAVNGIDANQIIDIDAGDTSFRAQAGSPPIARFVRAIGDFLWLFDATNRKRAVNSAFNNPEGWTIGTNLCDEFIMPGGGNIAAPGLMGEYGIILQDGGAARRLMSIEGDPVVAWRLEEIAGVKPAINGYGAISAKSQMYYLAENGPYSLAIDGTNQAIGEHRVAKEFLDNCDAARAEQFLAFADPYSSRIYWAYYKTSNSTVFDGLLGYDIDLNKLFFADIEAEFFAPIIVPGLTQDQLDAFYASLDAMTISLDSRAFQAGRPSIGAIKANGKLAMLSGPELAATWRIAPVQLVPGMRALLDTVDAKGEWGSDAILTLRVGVRENTRQATTWRGPYTPSQYTGLFQPRVSSRIFELELAVSGSGWKHAQALETVEKPDGMR
jgi:hypothetical protein